MEEIQKEFEKNLDDALTELGMRRKEKIQKSQAQVYAVELADSSQQFALKVTSQGSSEIVQQLSNELRRLRTIQGEHIIRCRNDVPQHLHAHYCFGILLERAKKDLHEMNFTGPTHMTFAEKKRALRHTALALNTIHALGYAHNDVRAENVLLFEGGVFKLADFGLCTPVDNGRGEEKISKQKAHWENCDLWYTAPEIKKLRAADKEQALVLFPEGIDERKADVFSFGVMAYVLVFDGKVPFLNANCQKIEDVLYGLIARQNWTEFWDAVKISVSSGSVLKEDEVKQVRELIEATLCADPAQRNSIEELLQLPLLSEESAMALERE